MIKQIQPSILEEPFKINIENKIKQRCQLVLSDYTHLASTPPLSPILFVSFIPSSYLNNIRSKQQKIKKWKRKLIKTKTISNNIYDQHTIITVIYINFYFLRTVLTKIVLTKIEEIKNQTWFNLKHTSIISFNFKNYLNWNIRSRAFTDECLVFH